MTKAAAAHTLRKLGADLRWLIEGNGVDPERAHVVIVVETKADRERLTECFAQGFDAGAMARSSAAPHQVTVHGVRIAVSVREPN